MSDMGTFRTTIQIASHERPSELREIPDTLVDTGSELTWVPRDILEELGVLSDMVLLGARAMEGLNLRVEPRLKLLVDAGPIDAGGA